MALVNCPDCGHEVSMNATTCPYCGKPLRMVETTAKKWSIWCWCALASMVAGLVTLFKGIDRMINYDSGDSYPYEAVNAYVGGDAYNLIINGTHCTAFFVLTATFFIMAIGFIIIHYLSTMKK